MISISSHGRIPFHPQMISRIPLHMRGVSDDLPHLTRRHPFSHAWSLDLAHLTWPHPLHLCGTSDDLPHLCGTSTDLPHLTRPHPSHIVGLRHSPHFTRQQPWCMRGTA